MASIEVFQLYRASRSRATSSYPWVYEEDDEGEVVLTNLKISTLGQQQEPLNIRVEIIEYLEGYDGETASYSKTISYSGDGKTFIDRISSTGVTDDPAFFELIYSSAFPSFKKNRRYEVAIKLQNATTSAIYDSETFYVGKAFTNLHLSPNPEGGVAMGKFCANTTELGYFPKFECEYPAYFYNNVYGILTLYNQIIQEERSTSSGTALLRPIFTADVLGVYLVTYISHFAITTSSTGYRRTKLFVRSGTGSLAEDTEYTWATQPGTTTSSVYQSATAFIPMRPGECLYVEVYQNSGSSVRHDGRASVIFIPTDSYSFKTMKYPNQHHVDE